jgi:hypothetical protein
MAKTVRREAAFIAELLEPLKVREQRRGQK